MVLAGTALGCTLAVSAPAAGQAGNISYTGAGPYTLTQTTPVSGGPRAIDITVTSGDTTVDTSATTVTTVNNGTADGTGVAVNNSGPGNVTVRTGDITASGSGRINTIDARATTGTITVVNSGSINASGNNGDRAIVARSGGGNVAITSNVANGQQYGIIVTGNGGTFGDTGTTTINSTTATANGTGLVNAIVAQGNRVVLTSGTATNTNVAGNQGTAIFVNASTGGALVNAGTTTALGQNQAAIQIFSEGAVDVTSGTIRTTQNSDGLSIASGTDIVARSTAITLENGGRGIVLGGNAGGGGFNSGADGFAYTSASVTSGTITTAGANAYGIYVTPNGNGTTAITSGAITTTGAGASGVYVTAIGNGAIGGATTINSTGQLRTSGANATGVLVNGGTGAVTVNNTGLVSATGVGSAGISLQGGTGARTIASDRIATGSGNGIDVSSDGTVNISSTTITRNAAGFGINVAGSNAGPASVTIASGTITGGNFGINAGGTRGDTSITSGAIALTTTASGTGTSLNGYGIFANGTGAVTINSGSVAFTGTGNTAGIQGQAGGNVTITSRDVSAIGNGGYGILGASQTGAVTIASTGTITTTGTTRQAGGQAGVANSRYADGILAYNPVGAINVTNTGTINTAGQGARGISAEAGRAIQSFGVAATTPSTAAVTITNSGAINTAGRGATGINVLGDAGAITVTSNAIATTGAVATGIVVGPGATAALTGPVTINSDAINVSGAGSSGIIVSPTGGTTTITSRSVLNSGDGSGIVVQQSARGPITGDIKITSGDITLSAAPSTSFKAGISVFPTTGATSIASTGTLQSNGLGILTQTAGATQGAVSIASNVINSLQSAISTSGSGAITINAATTTVTGDNQQAILVAPAAGGTVNVQAGTIATTGANALGVYVAGGATGGAATVTVGTATTTGSAIDARSAGPVTLTAGTVRTTGTTATGITAVSARDTATVTSTDLTSANRGIYAQGLDSVSVTSGTLVSTNADFGLLARTSNAVNNDAIVGTGAGVVNVTSANLTASNTGINAFGPRATINVTSTNVTAGNANGIEAYGLDVNVRSGSVTTAGGSGINAGNANGATRAANVVVNSGTIAVSGTTQANTVALSTLGQAIDITSGTITTSGTGNRAGINAVIATQTAIPNDGTFAGNVSINSGSVTTVGDGAYGIRAVADAGTITINSTGTVTTSGGSRAVGDGTFRYSDGIEAVSFNGSIAITSNNIATSGAGVDGIRAEANSGTAQYAPAAAPRIGTVSVTSNGTISATGAGSNGIRATTGADAVSLVNAGSITTSGLGGHAILATTTTGNIAINSARVASSGGVGATGEAAHAIFATSGNGRIDATIGSASASGAGADAVRLIANGTNGAVTLNVTGAVSSSSGNGVFIDPPGPVVVNVAAGGSVTGALAGINTTGGTNTITNLGTISSSGGAAIVAAGPTAIDNSGMIAGANGVAVQLGAANDSVTLRTGSSVTGRIVGGGGSDAAILVGASGMPVATQTVAGFDGFDRLTVQSGYWTAAPANPSAFNSATIASGASLEVANGATGIAGITTPSLVDNGTLVVRSSAASAGNTFGATTVTGTGGVLFTGAGTTSLAGTNSLQNTGTNTIDSGTVLVTGTQGGTFVTTTNGTLQLGNGATGGTFTGNLANNGTLIVNRADDSSFNGALTGAGLFVKQGAGRVTFGSGYAFTGTTQLNGGAIRLSTPVATNTEFDLRGTGTLDLSGQSNTIAELAGNSASASINIAGGSLTVNQATSTTFAGSIVGAGTLSKTGTGTLNLTGTSTYAGPTAVNGGRLAVNGSIVSPVFVNAGGTLGGTGSVGSTTVASGGTWAPGNSIGTQTVNGNVAFAAGSMYQVEANAAGAADRINATGNATLSGGTVQVLAENGGYARRTDYTILTAAGGVSGRFAGVTSNLAFLSPSLGYGLNAVTLSLTRNDVSFASVAATDNQRGVAGAIFARGVNDPLFTNILFRSEDGARTAFTALSGELNAGLNTELADNGRRVRQAVLDRGAIDSTIGGDGLGLWVQGLQSTALSDATTERARLHANRTGVIGGIDYTAGALRIGGFGGYQDDHVTLRNRASSAKIDTAFAGANVAWHAGPLLIQAGGLYAWHDVDTTRSLADAGLGTATASPDANSAQLFAEAGYALTDGPVLVTPFIRNAYTWSRVKAFAETGGTGALTVARDRRDIGLASAGIRLDGSAPLGNLTFVPRLSIAYQRGYGDLEGIAVQRFGGTGPAFVATGASLGKDGMAVDGGFDVEAGRFSIGVGGFASTSNRWGDYGGKVAVGLRF